MIAVSRFRIADESFGAELRAMCDFWSTRPGCLDMQVVRNLDEPDLWAVVSRWTSVGDYRRSFNGYEAKLALTPTLLRAIDEPSAYLPVEEFE